MTKKMLIAATAMFTMIMLRSANARPDAPLAFEAVSVRQRIHPAGSLIRRPHFNSGTNSCDEPLSVELFDCGISGTRFSDSPASLLDLIMDARYPDPSTLLMRALRLPLPALPTPREDVANGVNKLEGTSDLKLVPRKEPLVIDHVERPTAN